MAGRREQVLDAAVEILGTGGLRRLTYQAVDAAADAPVGTTSNHFRSRDLLVAGVVDHLETLDARDWASLAAERTPEPTSEPASGHTPDGPEALSATLAGLVRHALGPARHRTAARYTLALEGLARPTARTSLARAQQSLMSLLAPWLESLGSTDPAAHGRILFDYVDGAIFHQVTLPTEDFDPEPGLRAVLTGLLPRA
ncbi:TetR/AcrR family transcriptional regulator [Streptomyces sp. B-S-A8]|uniref:TetR/AcrR family transcriptional regulator n=1 Tax=Streptomyces solicavernae TaxID=3043614 RepID=A0ABT6RT99_9ACTN|nr:TetR/AcrR family transcriptional regulator [Streptomyces sp. B-S-A8]MDI3387649.1 TetR/AcrR family transcriptional regulator [Streptomyces sp. B-S-A8]